VPLHRPGRIVSQAKFLEKFPPERADPRLAGPVRTLPLSVWAGGFEEETFVLINRREFGFWRPAGERGIEAASSAESICADYCSFELSMKLTRRELPKSAAAAGAALCLRSETSAKRART